MHPDSIPYVMLDNLKLFHSRNRNAMKLTRPTPKSNERLRPEPSNWPMALGLSETWTVELLPPPVDWAGDPDDAIGPDAPVGKTMIDVEASDCPAKPVLGDVAGKNSSVGDIVPLGPCWPSNPMASEVWPLAPMTGVARTASEVIPLAPTTGVNMTAGDVRPLAAATGVEKTAREVRPLAPTIGEGITAKDVRPLAPAMGVKTVAAG